MCPRENEDYVDKVYISSQNGVIWWYDEETEDIEFDFEDCMGG